MNSRLAISKASSDFTFEVRELQYDLELGWRGARGPAGSKILGLVGQRGVQNVDTDGARWVQYVGGGLESAGWNWGRAPARTTRSRGLRVDWRFFGGPVVDDRSVDADAVVEAGARVWLGRVWRDTQIAFDFEIDGLIDGSHLAADVTGGPRWWLPVAGGRSASFFLHYQKSDNPLGIGVDTWLFGFAYEEHEAPTGDWGSPPDIDGFLAAGGGDSRLAGTLKLRFLSPAFAGGFRAVFDVDGNILTGEETDELYYLYHVGLERPVGGAIVGAYFYHRSNHQLSEPNDRVTNINVLELGVETPGRALAPLERAGDGRFLLDGWGRIGYLVDSSFGESERYHLRGGGRLILPGTRRVRPYLTAEAETGDVTRESFALGLALPASYAVQVEYRRDDQYFGRDDSAWLAMARRFF